MTKKVRIENADTSHHKVRVRKQVKNSEGVWVDLSYDSIDLNSPTQMADFYIHGTCRLIVEENDD